MNFLQRRTFDILNLSNFLSENNSFIVSDYINSSKASCCFYSKFCKEIDEETIKRLLDEYKYELKLIIENLGRKEYSDKEIVLNYLEYIRLTGMNENLDNSIFISESFEDVCYEQYLEFLRQGPFNALLLGKGSSSSQTILFRELLKYSNFKEFNIPQFGVKSSENYDVQDVIITNINFIYNNIISLKPSLYDGSLKSLERELSYHTGYIDKNDKFDVQLTDIMSARNRVLEYLVKKHNIEELKYKIGITEESTPSEKFDAIIDYIKNNVIINEALCFGSIEFDNKEFECGKFFEMLCYACGVHIYFVCLCQKQNTTYYGYSGKEVNVFNFNELYEDWKNSKYSNTLNKNISNESV